MWRTGWVKYEYLWGWGGGGGVGGSHITHAISSIKLEILWAMLTKWYPSSPICRNGKVLVLRWETPKSCGLKFKIRGAVWHYVVNNSWKFHEIICRNGKNLVLLWETPKSCGYKFKIGGAVWHHVVNNSWKFHEILFSGLRGVAD